MKKFSKIILMAITAGLMLALLFVSAFAADNGINSFSVTPYEVAKAKNSNSVNWWLNEKDGKYYFFLPSNTDRSALKINIDASDDVVCNGVQLTDGMTTDVFSTGTEFTVTCADETYNVVVLTSSNIAAIYVTTESGSLDSIHADKEYKEPGTALIIDKDGNVQYDGNLDYMKGRGNSTWQNDKKPYNIKLEKKTNLFGMGKSKKWCMLANHGDPTFIRNQYSYDLARQSGVAYTSDTVQFDFYVNGEYRGLYMLTEKVEIDDNRIEIYDLEGDTEKLNELPLEEYERKGDISTTAALGSIKYVDIPNNPENITGGYLLELEKRYRYPDEISGFVTKRGQNVVIKQPEYASKAQVEYISAYFQDFEDALYSPTGYNSKGKHYSEYADIDSIARMYIMDEYTMNFDNCTTSFYFAKDIGGKLVAGPAWDFDFSLGRGMENIYSSEIPTTADPEAAFVRTCWVNNTNKTYFSLLAQCYQHDEFQAKVSDMWTSVYLPLISESNGKIDSMRNDIYDASVMDGIFWRNYTVSSISSAHKNLNNNINSLKDFIAKRTAYLNNAFAADTYYVKYYICGDSKKIVYDTKMYKAGDKAVVATVKSLDGCHTAVFSDKPDGSGNTYKAGDTITVNGNTVLYPTKWKLTDPFGYLIHLINQFIYRLKHMFK